VSTDGMKEGITETSPQVYARIGGVLYLMIIVIGGFVSETLVVSGDDGATAANLMAHKGLFPDLGAFTRRWFVCSRIGEQRDGFMISAVF
jgi:hypothetical protein